MGRTLVRLGVALRGEVHATLRQPRLLLTLVVGPLVVLFGFGLAYGAQLPTLSTLVVGSQGPLLDEVDAFIRSERPAEIDYRGVTDDEDAALRSLRDGNVDLVVVLPDHPLEALGSGQRTVIEIHQRSLDPLTSAAISVAATTAVDAINDRALQTTLALAQQRSEELAGQLETIRDEFDTFRAVVDEADIRRVQRTAGQIAPQLDGLADALQSASGPASLFGLDRDVDDLVDRLRGTARQLDGFSAIDGVAALDDAQASLGALDDAVAKLRAVDPAVAVRPFQAEVVRQTPVEVTATRFFAPGLMALMLQHIGIILAAFAIVGERRTQGPGTPQVEPATTGRGLAATTGRGLAGGSAARLVLGGVVAAALTVVIVTVFEVPAPGSWAAFVGLVVLTILASLGIGSVIASVSASDSQMVQLAMLLLLTSIFFSGLLLPVDRIGMPIEVVSWLLPSTYAFAGFQQLMLADRSASWALFAGLATITVVTFVAARLRLPRRPAGS